MTSPALADINVLILTYGAANKHMDLVEAVTGSGVSPKQIVLIHNPDGSPDGARPWAPSGASTLVMPRNVGYGHAMNAGIRFAAERGAEWLLLLTHDVQFADSALTTLLAAREHGDGFAVLGPALRRADDGSVYSFGGVDDAKTLVRSGGRYRRMSVDRRVRDVGAVRASDRRWFDARWLLHVFR
jgi:GT2 family glycosyltransferase